MVDKHEALISKLYYYHLLLIQIAKAVYTLQFNFGPLLDIALLFTIGTSFTDHKGRNTF